MKAYASMTNTDLVNVLKAVEANTSARTSPDPLQRVVNDLQAHQIEAEIQNRELRDAMQQLEESRERYARRRRRDPGDQSYGHEHVRPASRGAYRHTV
jgi:hypothetical protein